MRPTVLLTDNDLGDRSLETKWLQESLNAEVIIANCKTASDVLNEVRLHKPTAIVTQWAPLDAQVLKEAASHGCKIISRIGIGIDMIDLEAAKTVGIPVQNVPHYCTEEVATHAVAMALSLWRRLPQLDAEVRAGVWAAAPHANSIDRLSGATLGLIGCGKIGSLVGKAFEVWGTRVIVVDPAPAQDSWSRVTLEQLAAEADIISLHAPLMESTHHMVNSDFLNSLERKPVLVNTSRGGLIDLPAAVTAVTEGKLRGLGLDVFEEEPLATYDPVRLAPNTLLCPHAAWCSLQSLPDLRRGAIDNVIEALS